MNNDAKTQIVDLINGANNVLIAVSRDPSVDQLAAAIGLALFLNKLNKHATAVFSGTVPPAIDFLEPGKTLEKNTDSLRDFIISLDKSKADKLRYKVEDDHVKIFITPYRTSITDQDLNFSQGDFNVDVVVALGVKVQDDLDQAITAHGRILHDATVMSLSVEPVNEVGSVHWVNPQASSLCEMVADLSQGLKADGLDSQIATAMLTGVVAETARFSNERTTAATMSVSAALLAAGANQQLVADSLQPKPEPEPVQPAADVSDQGQGEAAGDGQAPEAADDMILPPVQNAEPPKDGSLVIEHNPQGSSSDQGVSLPSEVVDQIHINDQGEMQSFNAPPEQAPEEKLEEPMIVEVPPATAGMSRLITTPPTLGGTLTANTQPEGLTSAADVLGQQFGAAPLLNRDGLAARTENQTTSTTFDPMAYITEPISSRQAHGRGVTLTPPSQAASETADSSQDLQPQFIAADADIVPTQGEPTVASDDPQTLEALEAAVHSPHLDGVNATAAVTMDADPLEAARQAVSQQLSGTYSPEPIQALNAQPVDLSLPGVVAAGDATAVMPGLSAAPLTNVNAPAPPVPPPLMPTMIQPSAPAMPGGSNPMGV